MNPINSYHPMPEMEIKIGDMLWQTTNDNLWFQIGFMVIFMYVSIKVLLGVAGIVSQLRGQEPITMSKFLKAIIVGLGGLFR